MNDQDVLNVTMQVTQLRSNFEYRDAGRILRPMTRESMSAVKKRSPEYSALRLQIGTWDRIAHFVKDFSDPQRSAFFKTHPVKLMWDHLSPGITTIRRELGDNYAKEFEDLANSYQVWVATSDGQQFRTADALGVHAMFC
jgi:hypothetical protein